MSGEWVKGFVLLEGKKLIKSSTNKKSLNLIQSIERHGMGNGYDIKEAWIKLNQFGFPITNEYKLMR